MTSNIRDIARAVASTPHQAQPQTKTGWQQLVLSEPAVHQPLSIDEYSALSPSMRREHNLRRLAYHSGLNSIKTTQYERAFDALDERFAALSAPSRVARQGAILTGIASAGKSTALVNWLRQAEIALRDAHKRPIQAAGEPVPRCPGGGEYIPVVYVSVASQLIPTLVNLVSFYNPSLPTKTRYAEVDLKRMLFHYIEECETKVVAVDQLQQLKNATKGAQAISDFLKDLMDACPTTMLTGAGIGLDRLRVLSDGYEPGSEDLAQTSTRFTLVQMTPYKIGTKKQREEWFRLLETVDTALDLLKSEPHDLVKLSDYIYDRTQGLTGEVIPLLRTAANLAINSGTERITEEILGKVNLSASRTLREQAATTAPAPSPVGPPSRRRARSHLVGTPAPTQAAAS